MDDVVRGENIAVPQAKVFRKLLQCSSTSLRGLERELAIASAKMDFSEPDAAPADVLNRAIWHSVKGYDTPYPRLDLKACVPALTKEGATRLF